MLERRVIRPSVSPWASPVVLVKKKNGTYRFCVDYRKLNAITKRDTYPLPRIDELLDKLAKATYFSTMDLASGYWQIAVEEASKEKTAFVTDGGHFEFNVLPFGLSNSPSTFMRCMNYALMDQTHAMAYLDDILVFSTTFSEHVKDLEMVFQRLTHLNLMLKLEKCCFFKRSVHYLGHVVSGDGIAPDEGLIEKIQQYPIPKNVKEVQSFLGLASYYRKFIRNFAKKAQPLFVLLKKSQPFNWTEEQQDSLALLKQCLVQPPILAHPDFTKSFELFTDASGYAIGAILGQDGRVIAYSSRSLKPGEKNYSTIEKEALAIVAAVKQFKHYLYGHHIKLYSDHKPLTYLFRMKDQSSRVVRDRKSVV
jgi:hypothetical protein